MGDFAMNDTPVDVLARLARLERDNALLRRRVRLLLLGVLTCMVVAIGGAATLQQTGRFQKSVEVFDADNVLRCVLFADDSNDKSGLEIKDPQGRVRLAIHTNQNDDPFITFMDKGGRERIELGIGPNGDAFLMIAGGQGNIVHNLRAAP
ncbi:MAG TPA: hypothetical protein VG826_09000 [Pirellulales bacterium]|nr:hypothetical protein [Pirellulales bacterium]